MNRLAALVFVTLLLWAPVATAEVAPCTSSDGDVTCPKERFQLLRDKARVGQLLCEALDAGDLPETLPEKLRSVCESASLTSRIWADAKTKAEHAEAADELQRTANVKEGRIVELKEQNAGQATRIEDLSGELAVKERQASRRKWWAWGGGTAAALFGAVVVGDVMGWWEF